MDTHPSRPYRLIRSGHQTLNLEMWGSTPPRVTIMRAEANHHILAIWDPLSTEDELWAAYRWWSAQVAIWARVNDCEIPEDIKYYVELDLSYRSINIIPTVKVRR